ncbi:MAG: Ste24 endopeptidase [Frankiales bacterium]|nr:Ste24 endopeptidase [Frankiales bacterium]
MIASSARLLALGTAIALGVALVAVVLLTTPWHALPAGSRVSAPDPTRDFSADEIARATRFVRAANVPGLTSIVLGLAVTLLLGFTHTGARLASVAQRLPGGWAVHVAVAALVMFAIGTVATLPLAAWRENVSRRYGLSVQRWPEWLVDRLRMFAVQAVLGCVILVVVVGLARAFPRSWWAVGAVSGAALVIGLSFASPLVIEPLFNRFTSMPAGELRDSLVAMAADDGVRVSDVLVADASRRTTALNAYVSGFGSTRRIVVYDTLLSRPEEEVRLVVAHELGHAARGDVLHGTILAAVGVAAAVCLLGFLLASGPLLMRAGVVGPGDPRAVALVLAVLAVLAAVSAPAQALVSRRIEARADVHSLDVTKDPVAFVRSMRELAVANLANPFPNPLLYALFADHPSVPERIAVARTWAEQHSLPVPPGVAPGGVSGVAR